MAASIGKRTYSRRILVGLIYHFGPGGSVGIATDYGLDGPGIESRWGARSSAPVQTGPGAHPASCTIGTGTFPGVKSGQGVTLTPHHFLVPWSRKSRVITLLPLWAVLVPWSRKSKAIPLIHLWAVRPVRSLSVCTRVYFTFYLLSTFEYKGNTLPRKVGIRLPTSKVSYHKRTETVATLLQKNSNLSTQDIQSMLPIGLFNFIESFNSGFPNFDTKHDCKSLPEIPLFHFRDTHTQKLLHKKQQ